MMKLFLLGGFRGIVADLLWLRAEEYKNDHDWDRLETTVELITKLQPHFLSIWTFQGWNLAYNVSVEWDAPEDKYTWIKQGIKFVQEGVKKNRRSPDLIWDTAWFYYHKMGFSDESIILRRLFRDDEDESFKTYDDPETDHPRGGQRQFQAGIRLVLEGGQAGRLVGPIVSIRARATRSVTSTRRRSGRAEPTTSPSARCRLTPRSRYAAGLEKMSISGIPATFGEVAKAEWSNAWTEWDKFGHHVFMSHNEVPRDGKLVRDKVKLDDVMHPERYKEMPENQLYWTQRWSDQMNYRYWKERCQAEATTNGVLARQLFYEATRGLQDGRFPQGRRQVQGRARALEDGHERVSQLSRRRSQQEGHRPHRQAVSVVPSSNFRCPFPTTCRSRTTCRSSRTTPRLTRSTPSRCSASPRRPTCPRPWHQRPHRSSPRTESTRQRRGRAL